MSAAKRARELGADSVRWVAQACGKDESTMYQMYRKTPQKFDIYVAGCVRLYGDNRLKEQLDEIMRML